MTREQEIFTAGFVAGLARAAHLRDPRRFPPAPNMATATALFEQAGGLEAFMTMRGVDSALDDAIPAREGGGVSAWQTAGQAQLPFAIQRFKRDLPD